MKTAPTRAQKLVEHLVATCDAADWSALRRAARTAPAQAVTAHRLLAGWVSDSEVDSAWEKAVYGVAGALATCRGAVHRTGAPIGQALRSALGNGAESRTILLCRSSQDDLIAELPRILTQVHNARSYLDVAQLLTDVYRWPQQRDRIAHRWLREFYKTTPDIGESPETTAHHADGTTNHTEQETAT